VWELKTLNYQDLLDLVDGAAIFSAGGGGSPEGYGSKSKEPRTICAHRETVQVEHEHRRFASA
jgi:DUF917 family protein